MDDGYGIAGALKRPRLRVAMAVPSLSQIDREGHVNDAAAARRRFLRYLAASPLLALPAYAQQRIATEVLKASDALNVFELEAIAKRNVPVAHWGYLSGGVLDDRTVQSNRQAFDAWGL